MVESPSIVFARRSNELGQPLDRIEGRRRSIRHLHNGDYVERRLPGIWIRRHDVPHTSVALDRKAPQQLSVAHKAHVARKGQQSMQQLQRTNRGRCLDRTLALSVRNASVVWTER